MAALLALRLRPTGQTTRRAVIPPAARGSWILDSQYEIPDAGAEDGLQSYMVASLQGFHWWESDLVICGNLQG